MGTPLSPHCDDPFLPSGSAPRACVSLGPAFAAMHAAAPAPAPKPQQQQQQQEALQITHTNIHTTTGQDAACLASAFAQSPLAAATKAGAAAGEASVDGSHDGRELPPRSQTLSPFADPFHSFGGAAVLHRTSSVPAPHGRRGGGADQRVPIGGFSPPHHQLPTNCP